ncbi:3-oxoacid CoA-transferase subunit B [Ornithinibacillus halophilus]|uniref:3-oxoacid CoA-transferase n=1 Tax=Ornithinibacillus halophilus TaxID=930117 RepID=A0A1M5GKW6_9BACI|nr:3-oxoacid CoA-transferase subunit B [Ornithinibacillus halophilus]SHG04152.1 3-oxoacid CoA-transferase [Ornithinibacillus halophilus]
MNIKEKIARNVERYLQDEEVVNLGIGIPTIAANYIKEDKNIYLHSENGILGVDSIATADNADPNIVNAGKIPVSVQKGVSYFNSADSFAMIRGGHVDVAVIGALQVDKNGLVANWNIPGKNVLGVGGAMDLLEGVKKVIIATTHTTKDGKSKLVEELEYPLTSLRPADLIITDLGVFEVEEGQLFLIEILPEATLEEIKDKTDANFKVKIKETVND